MVVIDGVNYLTVDEVCRLLDVKPATIYAYVSRGVLHSYKQGIKRQRLYREDEIQQLLVIRPPEQEGASEEPSIEEPPAFPTKKLEAEPEHTAEPTSASPLPDARSWITER